MEDAEGAAAAVAEGAAAAAAAEGAAEGARRWVAAIGLAVLAIAAVHAQRGQPGGRAGAPERRSGVTFTQDVAPIVFRACAPCHRPDGPAPFSLLTFEDVKTHASAIVAATERRIMPPWKPEPGYAEFADERRLSDEQVAVFRAWADGGLVEGDRRRLPPTPKFGGEWALGEPDLVLVTPPYTVRATGDDIYRNFVVPVPAAQARYVKAWQFLPGNPRVVHHATMQFDVTGASRQLDAVDPEPGYEGLIPHSVGSPEGFFLGWLPGHTPYVAPNGMAWPVPQRADLVMMLHLRPSGKEETVQAKLGLYFSDAPPRLHPVLVRLTKQSMDIPAGDAHYVVTDSFPLDADVDAYTVQPHAHYLAKEVKAFATLPDGSRRWLIYIRQWDFDWQGVFRYMRPLFLPAGTTLTMEFTYDNSGQNPHNHHRPPGRVTFGERTSDEMAELWLQVVPRNPADAPRLTRAVHDKVVREDIVGLEKRLEIEPENTALHDDVALLHAETGRLDRTAAHFAETVRLTPNSAPAHYNLGNVLFRQGRRSEAIEHLTRAVTLKPDYALAHDALGVARYTDGQVAEAIDQYHRALAVEPANPDAHHHLAVALRRTGRLSEAIEEYRRLLAIEPGRADARSELADTVRQAAQEQRPR